jgi:hypothetical protein
MEERRRKEGRKSSDCCPCSIPVITSSIVHFKRKRPSCCFSTPTITRNMVPFNIVFPLSADNAPSLRWLASTSEFGSLGQSGVPIYDRNRLFVNKQHMLCLMQILTKIHNVSIELTSTTQVVILLAFSIAESVTPRS